MMASFFGRGRSCKTGARSLTCVGSKCKLWNEQKPTAAFPHIAKAGIHAAGCIFKDAIVEQALQQPLSFDGVVAALNADQHQQSDANLCSADAPNIDACFLYTLQ